MAADTKSTLLQALQALYHHPDAETRNSASKWLEQFQDSQEAWQVSYSTSFYLCCAFSSPLIVHCCYRSLTNYSMMQAAHMMLNTSVLKLLEQRFGWLLRSIGLEIVAETPCHKIAF